MYAPHARKVFVIGEFNDWNETTHELKRLEPEEAGIFELFVPNLGVGSLYKYLIETPDGRKLYKADPYANSAEMRPGTASRIVDIDKIKWTDDAWMKKRAETGSMDEQPMSIYEVHPGSWMRHPGYQEDTGFYTYREFAKSLCAYVKRWAIRT